jgi:D-alanyl-D-alanine carboxypeptidase/D-alanyl-D-alanine-endopeptidase (penicillin-binding protein 4)
MVFPLSFRAWRTRPALLGGALALCLPGLLQAQGLPPEVDAALRRAKLPPGALVAVLQEAGTGQRKLAHNDEQPVNPASVFKLFTTYAALDLLGPAWTWSTPVLLSGTLRDGVLDGSVALRGSGDPKLVVERVWLMLRRLQQLGVREIRGDIVLDRSAFAVPEASPAEFDGDPSRPYNVRPDALMLNYKSVIYSFTPDPACPWRQAPATTGAAPSRPSWVSPPACTLPAPTPPAAARKPGRWPLPMRAATTRG